MATTSTRSATSKERFWRGHVEGWQRGGLSQREYCDQHGLALSTFTLWKRRLLFAGAPAAVPGPVVEIVPLRHTVRALEVPVVLYLGRGQYRLELLDGFHAETLRAVVAALEAC